MWLRDEGGPNGQMDGERLSINNVEASPTTEDDTVMVVDSPADASLPGTESEAELLEKLPFHVETSLHDRATAAGSQRWARVLHLVNHVCPREVSGTATAKLLEADYRKIGADMGRADAMQEVQLETLRSANITREAGRALLSASGLRSVQRRAVVLILLGVAWGHSSIGLAAPATREVEELQRKYKQLDSEGKYAAAIQPAHRACSILEKEVGKESEELATCLNDLGRLYHAQREYDKAKPFFERALAIRENVLGLVHSAVAESLNNLGELRREQADYDSAELLLERALVIRERVLGPDHTDVAESLDNLAALHQAQGHYGKAEPMLDRALTVLEKALGPDHPKVALMLNNVAGLHFDQGEYGEAERYWERALTILEKALGPDHPDVAIGLNNLAGLYQAQGQYGRAEPLHERALAIRVKTLGPSHPDVAESLDNLAMVYKSQGKYSKAEPLSERALAIRVETLGPSHPDVAKTLNNLAGLHAARGEYKKAAPLYERALAIWEKALGPDHPDVAGGIGNLGGLYQAQGEYGKAESLLERALAIREKALGPDHPYLAKSLNNLALLYQEQGEYGKAERLYERALSIAEKALGPSHHNVAGGLNNMAGLYQAQGEYGKAERLLEQALVIMEETLDFGHDLIGRSLNNLAMVYQAQGNFANAEQLLERALTIQEEALGPDHPDVATGLNNLAVILEKQGEYGRAQPLHERALAMQEKVLGPNHPDVAVSLHNLAILSQHQGNYVKAESLYKRALAIHESVLGHRHPQVALGLDNLGWLYLEHGQYGLAVNLISRALDIGYERLVETLLFSEERRRLESASGVLRGLDNVLSAHLEVAPHHYPSAELALTTLLRRKGLVLDLGARTAAAIRRSLSAENQHLLDDLSATRNRYAALDNRGPGPLSVERFTEQLVEIQREQQRLWRQLSDLNAIEHAPSKPVTIGSVQRSLPSDAVLVEFIRHRPRFDGAGHRTKKAGSARYAAYLVFPDRFDWVDLGPAEPIDRHIEAFRKALQLKTDVSVDLYDAVMRPIVEHLGDARRMFVAPDAELNLVPFGALYDGKQYLVERYDLHYLTTGRDLLRPWHASPTTDDDTVTVVASPSGTRLPGAEREVELLEELFPHVETLLHDAATEAGAQRRAQPWVLHLATHGFFEVAEPDPELEARMDEHLLSMSPSSLPLAPGRLDNPMLHSGLLLAKGGGAAPDTEADTSDEHITADGRLTAYEISGWDLRGTELVVLSACGTGLGEPRAGEGVLGLRRAFAMAGAQTQVMSLWDVSDRTTAQLMEAYYRKLLDGKGRGEAMQEVQLEMLRSGEHHPGDWASFVVVGEWRPLSRLPEAEGPPEVESGGCGCQRASIGGDGQPGLVLALLGLPVLRRRRMFS